MQQPFPNFWATRGNPVTGGGRPAVVLICDKNYFLPTLATALSAERFTQAGQAAILLFVVGADDVWATQFDSAVADTRIEVKPAQLPRFAELAQYHRDRLLPPIALARFWIDILLDPSFDRFLYLDGDTMVDAELDSLLATMPPSGGLMAAPDCIALFLDEISRGKRQDVDYLDGLGCAAEDYFNSGVIYATRSAWREIVPVAIDFMTRHPERCRSSDQSALNHAARGRVTLLSLHYNFQSEHKMVVDPRHKGFQPAVWHFTGGPKPWNLPAWPWDESFNRFYREAEWRTRVTDATAPVPPEAQMQSGAAHRRRSWWRLNTMLTLRKLSRRRKVLEQLEAGEKPSLST